MDQSPVRGRNVRTPLCGVIFGIFLLVHSGFSNAVLQDEVYREAVTEGYLIDGFFLRSTALPKGPETAEASQEPPSQSKDSDNLNQRLGAFHNVSTKETVELLQSSKRLSTESEGSGDFLWGSTFEGSGETTEQIFTTTENSPFKGIDETTDQVRTTTESSLFDGSGDTGDLVLTTTESSPFDGSGDTGDLVLTTTESSPFEGSGDTGDLVLTTTESSPFEGSGDTGDLVLTSTESSTAVVVQEDIDGSTKQNGRLSSNSKSGKGLFPSLVNSSSTNELGQSAETKNPQPGIINKTSDPHNDRTPGWIIIVAFIVGVAALVMLCVAIATRDKWNRPKQAFQPEKRPSTPILQKEVEMETFLKRDHPRENGEAEEYTVIQLDDIPDKYTSD